MLTLGPRILAAAHPDACTLNDRSDRCGPARHREDPGAERGPSVAGDLSMRAFRCAGSMGRVPAGAGNVGLTHRRRLLASSGVLRQGGPITSGAGSRITHFNKGAR
jgi:hypothetical protein